MAHVALCPDRESWLAHSAFPSNAVNNLSKSELGVKDANFPCAVAASSEEFVVSNPPSLNSVAFSLDDDEAQTQAKEYAHNLQKAEAKKKRQLDLAFSSSLNGAADPPAQGWTHGAEMKFDARELMVTKSVLLSGDSCAAKRAEIREYFHRTFSLYERLFELLADSDVFYRRPDSLRHPLIFYYGHTAVFFINKLLLGKFIARRIDEKMESTCAIGVDEMSWDDLNDAHYDWPTPEAVRSYRNLVRSTVDDVIQSAPLQLPITWQSPFWVILMGIEHERIHLETSAVLIRQLPIECVRSHPLWQLCPKRRVDVLSVPANSLICLDGGEVVLGKDVHTSELYGWDNEYGKRVRHVSAFAVSKFLVSNAEWLQFMADGAYDRQEFWSVEGWKFIQFKNAYRKYPIFWVPVDGTTAPTPKAENFRYRALSEIIDMPWDWPVEVNQLEAKAFTNWMAQKTAKKIRLPTEEEYNYMRKQAIPLQGALKADCVQALSTGAAAFAPASSACSSSISVSAAESSGSCCTSSAIAPSLRLGDQPYWNSAPGNVNLEWYSSSNPIDEFEFTASTSSSTPVQLFDVIGNVWQHTETPIAPFAGFQFHPLYDDFSIPTFDNMHNIIVGGSWISTGNEATSSARYAFRRHFYQHAGIRYVESSEDVVIEELTPSTETDVVVANMAAAHYPELGTPFGQLPNPFIQLARIIMHAVESERHRFTRVPFNSSLFTPRELSPMELAQLESIAHLPPTYERILDLGCGAGRLCFELAFPGNHPLGAAAFQSVLGIDLSTRFLRVGDSLKHGGKFHYLVKSEGELDAFHAIDLMDANSCQRSDMRWAMDDKVRTQVCSRVEFMQSDAHNFDGKHSHFDVLVLAHLLEDMYDPKQLLAMLHTRCKVGGLLVILSDYHWRSEKTDKINWLGGKKEANGESVNTLNALDTLLTNHFIRISKPQTVLQMRRCTDRVFTLHRSDLNFWRRVK